MEKPDEPVPILVEERPIKPKLVPEAIHFGDRRVRAEYLASGVSRYEIGEAEDDKGNQKQERNGEQEPTGNVSNHSTTQWSGRRAASTSTYPMTEEADQTLLGATTSRKR